MSHITRLQAENFKRIKVIDIRPGEGAVSVRGDNAQGKSSALDAIEAVFGGKAAMPGKPVRNGQDEGAIRIELDDGAVALRRFTVDGKGDTLEFTNAEGFKAPSPQRMLEALYSSVAFDPLAFTLQEPAKQVEALRSLVKFDVDLDELAAKRKAAFDQRTDVNRDLKRERAVLEAMPVYDVPETKVDTDALAQMLGEAAEHNGNIERRKAGREAFLSRLHIKRTTLTDLQTQLATIQKSIEALEVEISDDEAQVAAAAELPEPIDTADVQRSLQEGQRINAQVESEQRRKAAALLVANLEKQAEELTTAIETHDAVREEALERAVMPVDGLAFGEGEVLFNDVPLEQIAMSERIKIGGRIAAALNPKLKVMLVRDASLLSENGQASLAEMAAEHGFQLWIEVVDTSGKVGIVIEDGTVVAIDGEAAPEPEPIKAVKRRAKKPEEAKDADGAGGNVSPAAEDSGGGGNQPLDELSPGKGDAPSVRVDTPIAGTADERTPAEDELPKAPVKPAKPASLFD